MGTVTSTGRSLPLRRLAEATRTDVLFLAAYILIKPVYLWSSGLPQISDLVLLLYLPFVVMRILPGFKYFQPLLYFVFWSMAVNALWFGYSYDDTFILPVFYIAYNAIVFLFFYFVASQGPAERRVLSVALAVSLVLQLGYAIAVGGDSRQSGSFNDPNQLCYWVALTCGMFLICRDACRRLGLLDVAILLASIFLGVLSVSRSGLASILLVTAPVLFCWASRNKLVAMMLLVVLIGLTALFMNDLTAMLAKMSSLDLIRSRTDAMRQGVGATEWEVRGYARMVEYWHYMLIGAGEGGYRRFTIADIALEVHSTLGGVLFNFGIVGLSLVLYFLGRIYAGAETRYRAMLLAPIIYGFFQNGFRFSFFWGFLAVLAASGSKGMARSPVFRTRARPGLQVPMSTGRTSP